MRLRALLIAVVSLGLLSVLSGYGHEVYAESPLKESAIRTPSSIVYSKYHKNNEHRVNGSRIITAQAKFKYSPAKLMLMPFSPTLTMPGSINSGVSRRTNDSGLSLTMPERYSKKKKIIRKVKPENVKNLKAPVPILEGGSSIVKNNGYSEKIIIQPDNAGQKELFEKERQKNLLRKFAKKTYKPKKENKAVNLDGSVATKIIAPVKTVQTAVEQHSEKKEQTVAGNITVKKNILKETVKTVSAEKIAIPEKTAKEEKTAQKAKDNVLLDVPASVLYASQNKGDFLMDMIQSSKMIAKKFNEKAQTKKGKNKKVVRTVIKKKTEENPEKQQVKNVFPLMKETSEKGIVAYVNKKQEIPKGIESLPKAAKVIILSDPTRNLLADKKQLVQERVEKPIPLRKHSVAKEKTVTANNSNIQKQPLKKKKFAKNVPLPADLPPLRKKELLIRNSTAMFASLRKPGNPVSYKDEEYRELKVAKKPRSLLGGISDGMAFISPNRKKVAAAPKPKKFPFVDVEIYENIPLRQIPNVPPRKPDIDSIQLAMTGQETTQELTSAEEQPVSVKPVYIKEEKDSGQEDIIFTKIEASSEPTKEGSYIAPKKPKMDLMAESILGDAHLPKNNDVNNPWLYASSSIKPSSVDKPDILTDDSKSVLRKIEDEPPRPQKGQSLNKRRTPVYSNDIAINEKGRVRRLEWEREQAKNKDDFSVYDMEQEELASAFSDGEVVYSKDNIDGAQLAAAFTMPRNGLPDTDIGDFQENPIIRKSLKDIKEEKEKLDYKAVPGLDVEVAVPPKARESYFKGNRMDTAGFWKAAATGSVSKKSSKKKKKKKRLLMPLGPKKGEKETKIAPLPTKNTQIAAISASTPVSAPAQQSLVDRIKNFFGSGSVLKEEKEKSSVKNFFAEIQGEEESSGSSSSVDTGKRARSLYSSKKKKALPTEIKIHFDPYSAAMSGQTVDWLKALASKAMTDRQIVVEVRMSGSVNVSRTLQSRRYSLIRGVLSSQGLDSSRVRIALTDRSPDSVVLRMLKVVRPLHAVERMPDTVMRTRAYDW